MSIKYSCYFCVTIRDMGASWEVCTYSREEDEGYWMKEPPCKHLDNCPFYCSKGQAFDIIKKEVNKKKG